RGARDPVRGGSGEAGPAPGRELLPPDPGEVRSVGLAATRPHHSERGAKPKRLCGAAASGRGLVPKPICPTRKMGRKGWTLLTTCVAMFMLLLDISIVNVALPDIQRDLGSSFSDLQWVVDAYALTLASFLLTAGSLGDRVGRRLVFAVGFGVFTVASLL